jgi:hypothetical protein
MSRGLRKELTKLYFMIEKRTEKDGAKKEKEERGREREREIEKLIERKDKNEQRDR